jgi:phage/plasmid-associated DNA primase
MFKDLIGALFGDGGVSHFDYLEAGKQKQLDVGQYTQFTQQQPDQIKRNEIVKEFHANTDKKIIRYMEKSSKSYERSNAASTEGELLLEIRDLLKQLVEKKDIDADQKEFNHVAKYAPAEVFDNYIVDRCLEQMKKGGKSAK